MEDYNNKTKAELLEIIQNLEKKVEQLSSESASGRKERFRDRYSKRILDNLPDMLTVLDRNANIVELVSSPSTNHVEGTTADSITQSNIKDILPEDAYNNIRRNMEKVFSTGNSAIARHDLMQDGVSHHYEHWLSLLDKEYLLCMCRDVSQLWETEQTNAEQQNEIMRLNSLMQAIVNNVPVYLFVKDSGNDFRYLYWNKTFADYSGIPIEKAIGRNDFEIFKRTEDFRVFQLCRRLTQNVVCIILDKAEEICVVFDVLLEGIGIFFRHPAAQNIEGFLLGFRAGCQATDIKVAGELL